MFLALPFNDTRKKNNKKQAEPPTQRSCTRHPRCVPSDAQREMQRARCSRLIPSSTIPPEPLLSVDSASRTQRGDPFKLPSTTNFILSACAVRDRIKLATKRAQGGGSQKREKLREPRFRSHDSMLGWSSRRGTLPPLAHAFYKLCLFPHPPAQCCVRAFVPDFVARTQPRAGGWGNVGGPERGTVNFSRFAILDI